MSRLLYPCIVIESTVIYIDSGGDRLSLFYSPVQFFGVFFLTKLPSQRRSAGHL